jgi:hypothetical protein
MIDLTDEEHATVTAAVRRSIAEDRYPRSPRLAPFRSALAKLDPASVPRPLPGAGVSTRGARDIAAGAGRSYDLTRCLTAGGIPSGYRRLCPRRGFQAFAPDVIIKTEGEWSSRSVFRSRERRWQGRPREVNEVEPCRSGAQSRR